MNLWNMNSFEWYAVLCNISIWLAVIDIFLICCTTKTQWSRAFIRRHVSAYALLGFGWLVMHIGINLKSMDWLVKISLLGWLIWLTGIFLVVSAAYKKIRSPKNNVGRKVLSAISFTAAACLKILKKIYPVLILFPLISIAACADRWWFEKNKN